MSNILNTGTEVIISMIASNLLAQFIKMVRYYAKTKKFSLKLIFASGGMPSSHTSTVVAMACSVGLVEGFNSTFFAIALCVMLIVMYDATGVRRAASHQARVLNDILEELFSEHPTLSTQKLKEFLGHTPLEVLAGAILAVGVSLAFHYYLLA
ncbi:MAG: divergent PAP2 family protein [Flavobacteriales bacterium]|nr:divergent PAP2 family protein [Flavobacteriales bacterium]